MQAQATFGIQSWAEHTWDGTLATEVNGEKLTRAIVSYMYEGDIAGESQLIYVMSYFPGGSGVFTGLEQVRGVIGGRAGTFLLQHEGTFDEQGVQGRAQVVPGSGTGDLVSLRGSGSYDLAGQMTQYPITLEYELE